MQRVTVLLIALILALTSGTTRANTADTYGFITHASFFSIESKLPNLIDPHVFIPDSASKAGIGPQGVVHIAGYRPAYGVDDPATVISNAQGKSLGITLAQWFGARGVVTLSPAGAKTRALLSFSGLISGGRYSLFENHFAPSGVTFTPLDGTGKTNSFTANADGMARITVIVPGSITHAEALLLVFHSDGVDHGLQRGSIGIDAHHQLIMRVP